ncbi:hypothetical protein SAY86_005093 [Trapa natans]|uniref:Protein kinase domain-containing protein n=1 Tax=Trapa natans TaxID=22666 RepID=A0AAN7QUJ6_TRANT|nr:hypothetical protein SAY86_005093 [Trapa natans]
MRLSTSLFFFFLSAIHSSSALSFNYTRFKSGDNIILDRAFFSNGTIQLTYATQVSIGRATYNQSMQLWDKSTQNLTDFSTYFAFSIDSKNKTDAADGLAFFLTPQADSKIPDDQMGGLTLGLNLKDEKSTGKFVAVEFDIYKNYIDPPGTHVGIDNGSVVSVTNTSWFCNFTHGQLNEAWINYDSRSKNLSVIFTDYKNGTRSLGYLSYVIDLRSILPEEVILGFSAATGNKAAAHFIKAWNFTSTLEITKELREGGVIGLVVGISMGGLALVVGLVGLYWFCWRRKGKGYETEEEDEAVLRYMNDELEMESTMGPKRFSYAELAAATGNFKPEEKLGEGGFGGVYRGFLQSTGTYVAVKKNRISSGSSQGLKEYASEIKIISRLRHRNLVQLMGWCHQKRELLLVYEYMINGSLDFHLFKGKCFIPWNIRYKIAQGLASALLYLHEEWEQCVVHRDIKSSNIMLDVDFNAKLGDFGLARLVDHAKGSQTTTILAGTMGYMAPECSETLRSTKESDIYSFGVVCLEIACGRRAVDPSLPEDEMALVRWVWSLHKKGEVLKAADPNLGGDFVELEMNRLLVIGLSCTLTDSRLRPSAKQALNLIESDAPLPVLPAIDPLRLPANFFLDSYSYTATSSSSQASSATRSSVPTTGAYSSSSSTFFGGQ